MSTPPLRAIGIVRTPYSDRGDTPLQPSFASGVEGEVHLDPRYLDALDGLEGFSHVWLLTWLAPFDTPAADPELRQVPLLLRDNPQNSASSPCEDRADRIPSGSASSGSSPSTITSCALPEST